MYVERFDTARPEPARLGGKGAGLVRLVALGHRVPPGFVLTVDAFYATIEALGLRPSLDRLAASSADRPARDEGERIRRGLRDGFLPDAVLDRLVEMVDALGLWAGHTDGVIVRSSATVEDSASHSFAGMFESISIDRPQELEPTIREVWASAFAARVLTYLREVGIRGAPAMAIVVQRFLQAERSGVMFTTFAGPDGSPRTLVEHVEGGCEKLVRGEVTPDRLWLEGPDAVPQDLDGPLSATHARDLATLAFDLEEQLDGPQDVEWCIHDGVVHLVQSRPITTPFDPGTSAVEGGGTPVLTGVGASPGVGAGPAHLVFNIDQALRLEAGQVLVTPMTNPDMVVAMRNAAAIVTDVGGMICHAAIVSRELGLPCVVGTETATTTLAPGEPVTADGSTGAVYRGLLEVAERAVPARPVEWVDLWDVWGEATADRPDLSPMVSSIAALEAAPNGIDTAVLVPDVDLRAGRFGLWNDLEALGDAERAAAFDRYVERVTHAAADRAVGVVWVRPIGSLPIDELAAAVARRGGTRVRMLAASPEGPAVAAAAWPDGPAAVPLGAAATLRAGVRRPELPPMAEAVAAARDTIRFFGHRPGMKVAAMPDPAWRSRWWDLLPEYGRYHREFGTAKERGDHHWLEVRPELVISALLKSLVQPGFEMVPRVLGFANVMPLHVKWVRCRYHFRSDAFAAAWEAIVSVTWDEAAMAELMRRIRASYRALEEVLVLFPSTDEDLRTTTGPQMVALITSWWPRWIEFFALCWFIQAQGDDIVYPFVSETVKANLAALGPAPGDFSWPGAADLVAPTTPVMSGEYIADVGRLREQLLAAGLTTKDEIEAALARGEHPPIAARLRTHLDRWGWMRDRDLLFEPWDTPGRVIETALSTEPHAPPPYAENLRRNLLALSFHVDLAMAGGRAVGLNHATRFLHDLNVERENHHVLWLKDSYPLRRLCLEIERRLVESGSLVPGDVFFLQAPELIEAAARLPAPLPLPVADRVKRRRAGFEREARLAPEDAPPITDEDDYL